MYIPIYVPKLSFICRYSGQRAQASCPDSKGPRGHCPARPCWRLRDYHIDARSSRPPAKPVSFDEAGPVRPRERGREQGGTRSRRSENDSTGQRKMSIRLGGCSLLNDLMIGAYE